MNAPRIAELTDLRQFTAATEPGGLTGAQGASAWPCTRADVVAEARSWLGTPWHHQARLKGVGVDCAGLVIGVARELGLVEQSMDVTHYARMPDGVSLMAHCDEWMRRIEADAIQPGDVIVLRFDTDPQHLAIVCDYALHGLAIIHALDERGQQRGRVIEHRLDAQLRARIVAAYALPGVSA